MPEVHPTALVSGEAKLADDVVVGPGCVVRGDVTVGAGTKLLGHVYLQGPAALGDHNTVYPFTCVGFPPQHRESDPARPSAGVRLGDGNVLRESVTIHRATSSDHPTSLGDRNYLMANCHLGHDVSVASDCTLANGVLLAGHVRIGDRVVMGGNAVVQQFVRIGRLVMYSGLVGVGLDVPPFCTVYNTKTVRSLNLVGLRRGDCRDHIKPLRRAFDIFFKQNHRNATALELIESEVGDDELCAEFVAFIRAARRGITPYEGRRQDQPEIMDQQKTFDG